MRDERRTDYDEGRGGYGAQLKGVNYSMVPDPSEQAQQVANPGALTIRAVQTLGMKALLVAAKSLSLACWDGVTSVSSLCCLCVLCVMQCLGVGRIGDWVCTMDRAAHRSIGSVWAGLDNQRQHRQPMIENERGRKQVASHAQATHVRRVVLALLVNLNAISRVL